MPFGIMLLLSGYAINVEG